MGIKNLLLALLGDGPQHGYQLKVDLEAATGDKVAINIGQVYTTLQRLERDGLVTPGEPDHENRVDYTITEAGQSELADWAERAVPLAVAGRDEASMKVQVAIHTAGLDPLKIIEVQRSATMTMLQDLTSLHADETTEDDLAWRVHLDRLILSAESELRWLDRVEERLSKRLTRKRATDPVEIAEKEEVR